MKRWLRTSQLARSNRRQRSGAGYTITEALIVLAVTSMMFAAIVLLMMGRQARTEFTQAVRDYEGRLETAISEVVNGHYQAAFTCSASGTNPPTISATPSARTGINQDCIFAGKTIKATSTLRATEIDTLVGRRTVSATSSDNVDSLDQAKPVVATGSMVTYPHTFQLELQRMARLSDNVTLHAVGFINKFSKGITSSVSDDSGLVDLYGLTATPLANGTNNYVNLANFQPVTGGVVMCFTGQNGQRARITIGEDRNESSVVSTLDTGPSGVCP